MDKQDYYAVLGVTKNASNDDIKKAYRKYAMMYHPDRHSTDTDKKDAEIKFKVINEAYECLSDPQKRAFYDQHGHQSNQNHHNTHQHGWTHTNIHPDQFGDMFNMFGNIFSTHRQPQQQVTVLNISLVDAYTGKQLRLPGGSTINLPAGVRSGSKFFVDQNIYQVNVQAHPKFKRSNDDLLVDVDITAIEAMLGLDVMLTHLNNTMLQFTIPAGIQAGQVVRLAGKGLKNPETDSVGDLLVRIISTSIPKQLTDEQKGIINSLPHRTTLNM